jgi:predicted ATPase
MVVYPGQFLPFISQLKEYCNVYSLNSVDGTEIDYRRRHAQRPSLLYNSPLGKSVDSTMDKIFLQLTGAHPHPVLIEILRKNPSISLSY